MWGDRPLHTGAMKEDQHHMKSLVTRNLHLNFMPFSFDAIYCNAILEHVQDYESAIKNIHKILKQNGELFIYAPFFWCFHDRMDYHRFTLTELDRILQIFSEYKLFLPDSNGYGGVLWQVLTSYQIDRLPKLLHFISTLTNTAFKLPLTLSYILKNDKYKTNVSLSECLFYYLYFRINHGFCGWAKK
jgi:ubiquinone/menaquinone biosynthesis C-methylase UbiE